jgi:modulator of FtsH protease
MEYHLDGQTPLGRSQADERLAFIRNVYMWLMGGFVVAGVGALSAPFLAAALLPALGRAFVWVLFGAQFGSLLWATAVSKRKPMNRYAYAIFTYICGVFAGIMVSIVAQTSGFNIVLAAFALTAVDFLVLTGVAVFSKKDFSFLSSFILTGFVIIFAAILIGFFFHAEIFHLAISAAIVILCSAKILWDTSAMLRTNDFSDPAGFALSLFVSLLNIFISLLRLLGGRRD